MAKDRTFASKMSKAHSDDGNHCPKCGELLTSVKLVSAEHSKRTNAYRFNERMVSVCKCNEKEVYG